MKISIVTVVFNDRIHIEKTLDSVKCQNARNSIEYIVVDGNSTDGTSEILRSRINEIDIYIREKDSGIYNAMNKGLVRATGDYVIFMNSGDTFHDLDVIGHIVANTPEPFPALIYGNYCAKQNGEISGIIPSRKSNMIWYGPIASHQSTFYNLHFLNQQHLSYDESYRIAADYKLTLEVITLSKGNTLQLPLCISDFDMSGISNRNQNLGLQEANRVRKEVLGWGGVRSIFMTVLLLSARFVRIYGGFFYKLLRRYELK